MRCLERGMELRRCAAGVGTSRYGDREYGLLLLLEFLAFVHQVCQRAKVSHGLHCQRFVFWGYPR